MTIAELLGRGKALLGRIPADALVLLVLILASTLSFGAGILVGKDLEREKAGNGKRHHPMPAPVVKGIARASGVHVAEHRAHARSTLRANADRRNKHRAA